MSRQLVRQFVTYLHYLLFFLFASSTAFAQVTISGHTHCAGEAVAGARIDLRQGDTNKLLTYTFSDQYGHYQLRTTEKGRLQLSVNTLTHEALKEELDVQSGDIIKELHLHKAAAHELQEVIVHAKRPGQLKRDTIELDVQSFLQGNEKNVEDLLRKIPGLTVSSDGRIKVGQKEVEKVMVEGDDFFERGYRLLTQNMSVRPLEKVQVLQRYANNKHLKGIEHSDKVALNLTLKEDSKSEWIGSVAGSSTVFGKTIYHANLTLMNFGKKSKYFLLGSANNNGEDAVSAINHLIYSDQRDEAGQIGLGLTTPTLIDNNPSLPGLSYNRSNFNRDKLLSLNGIWNPVKNMKAKWLGFLNVTNKRFYRQTEQRYQLEDIQFSNTEDYHFEKSIGNYFSKWEFQYDIDQTSTLSYVGTLGSLQQSDISQLSFNGDPSTERNKTRGLVTNHNLTHTQKLSNRTAIVSSVRYIAQRSPMSYAIDKFYYQDLFGSDSFTAVDQSIVNDLDYLGFTSSYLQKQRNGNYLQIAFSSEYKSNRIHTALFLRDIDGFQEQPNGFSNQMEFKNNQQKIDVKYTFKHKKLEWSPQLQSIYLDNSVRSYATTQVKKNLLFSPLLSGKWVIKEKRIVEAAMLFQQRNTSELEVVPNYYTIGLRNFVSGMDDLQTLQSFGSKLNYTHGTMLDKFFALFAVEYNHAFDYISYRNTIAVNYNLTEQILLKDKRTVSFLAELNFYINAFRGNLKIDTRSDFSQYETEVAGIGVRSIQSTAQQYTLSFKSAWKYWLNLEASSNISMQHFQSEQTDRLLNSFSHLSLFIRLDDRTRASLKNEAYRFNAYQSTAGKTYYFSDLSLRYEIKKKRIGLEILAKNIFNMRQFENAVVTDTYRSVTSYRLLPRYISLGANMSF